MARILDRVALRVSVVGFQPDIDTDLLAGGSVGKTALRLDAELHIVAISTSQETNPLDRRSRKGGNGLLLVANQAKTAYSTAIGEREVFSIRFKFPARLLVLHASV